MREEKGRRRKEKENDSEGRSRRGRKGRRKGRRYASGLKPCKPKINLVTSLIVMSLEDIFEHLLENWTDLDKTWQKHGNEERVTL